MHADWAAAGGEAGAALWSLLDAGSVAGALPAMPRCAGGLDGRRNWLATVGTLQTISSAGVGEKGRSHEGPYQHPLRATVAYRGGGTAFSHISPAHRCTCWVVQT